MPPSRRSRAWLLFPAVGPCSATTSIRVWICSLPMAERTVLSVETLAQWRSPKRHRPCLKIGTSLAHRLVAQIRASDGRHSLTNAIRGRTTNAGWGIPGIRSNWKANYLSGLGGDAIDTFVFYARSRPSPRSICFLEFCTDGHTALRRTLLQFAFGRRLSICTFCPFERREIPVHISSGRANSGLKSNSTRKALRT
jgi:hypothetical protein